MGWTNNLINPDDIHPIEQALEHETSHKKILSISSKECQKADVKAYDIMLWWRGLSYSIIHIFCFFLFNPTSQILKWEGKKDAIKSLKFLKIESQNSQQQNLFRGFKFLTIPFSFVTK